MENFASKSPIPRTVCIPGEGRVKLRSSCDACSIAKLKCDSQNPCERCRDHAIRCVYSPSRRHGKQPWAKRVAEQHQRYLQSTMYTQPPHESASMGSFIAFQANPGANTFPIPSTVPAGAATSPIHTNHFVNSPMTSSPVDHNLNAVSNFQFPSSQAWHGVSAGIAPAPATSPTSSATLTMSESSMSPLLEPAFQSQSHDCEANALAMLHSLHMKSAESPTSGSAPQQIPPLDKILHTNRIAISTLSDLLQCQCAQQPHLALLYMATVSKALFWYRLAINLSFESSNIAHETRRESASPRSYPGHFAMSPAPIMSVTAAAATNAIPGHGGEAPMLRPRSSTIQIGSFDLEAEDEAILVRSVVMTEIKKAARLVEYMKSGGLQITRADEHGQDSPSVISWYRAGGEKLEREVQDTLREARGTGRIATNFEPNTVNTEQMWSA